MHCRHRSALRLLNFILGFVRVFWRGSHIGKGSELHCPFVIGRGTWISDRFQLKGYGSVHIGKYCAIGGDVKIITSDHASLFPSMNFILQSRITGSRFPGKIEQVHIGHDVWVGDSVVILAGARIGNGAVIGAGSIVTGAVEDYAIYAGNPARRIRDRLKPELAKTMLQIAWWDWSEERMRRNKNFFSLPVSEASIGSIKP